VAVVVVAGGLLARAAGADAPGRGRDEGALVAHAWALGRSLPEAARTVAPVRPTLASWQLAAWDRATGAFDRAPSAVAGGREAMVVALVASAALVWVLGRRLDLPRWAAAPGVAVAALSPLAADLHRTIQPGALAAPWLLAAFALARARHCKVVAAWAASGAALAVAVLTAPVVAVAAPAVAWQLWRTVRPSARARALPAFVAGAAAVLVPGWLVVLDRDLSFAGDTGLVDLGGRLARPLGDLLAVDPLTAGALVVAGVVAPVAARRFRPLAAAFWPLALLTLRADSPPATVLACAAPVGAVLLGGATEALWAWTNDVRRARRLTAYRASRGVTVVDALAPAALAALAVAGAAAVPLWASDHATALAADDDAAVRAAEDWLDANTSDDTRLVVDDSLWVDAVGRGTEPSDLATYGRLAGSWLDYDYVVLTPGELSGRESDDAAATATAASSAVAVFGEGPDRTEVRRIGAGSPTPDPLAVDPEAAGTALAGNHRLTFTPEADAALRAGQVDERVLTFLATVAVDHTADIAGFPLGAAEARAGASARTVDLAALDGRPISGTDAAVDDVMSFLERQPEPWYQPAHVDLAAGAGGVPVLQVTFPPA
jgi:hypothetical protein